MRRFHKSLVATGLVLVAASAHAQEVVRVQDYPGLGNMMLRVAITNGYCDKRGIKCEAKTIPAAPLGVQTLLAGDLDVAMAPPEVVIQAVNKGADLRIIGNGARNSNFFLMASTGLETPNAAKGYPAVMQDFKGKKVGVTARGSAAEFQLLDLLKGAGMKSEDITIVAVGAPNTAFPAIANKQIDGLMLFAPMDGFCEVSKACRIVVDPRKGEGPADLLKLSGAAVVLAVRADYTVKNTKALDALAGALREAEAFIQAPANYAAVFKIAQETGKINIPSGDQILDFSLRTGLPSYRFALEPAALQHAADYLHRTGQVDKLVDTARLLQLR
ncbi:ABC transporter substrate-binding protein [Sphaerotilus sp.]|uniref:ABC transporter substrate-binding protein n=1 Tax=Sphaerotilus sp. TaxID=2093942 RepID=UPI002ACDA0D1|nr:ABC transporter substrate-binding protein [Sphaerotilus sp.]MDZ7854680.1 ABC transporter substrate-binding protein [Sphaerotilus sp.]